MLFECYPFPPYPFRVGGFEFHSLFAWLSYFDHISWSGRQPAANHHLGDGLLVHDPFQGVWVSWVLTHTSLTLFGLGVGVKHQLTHMVIFDHFPWS